MEELSDEALLTSLKRMVIDDRRNLVAILKRLAEIDRRRLALILGFDSLFDYCVRELRYSEGETARRIHVARVAAKYPALYRYLGSGRLSLTAVSILAPHLTLENHRSLAFRALGRKTREIEGLVASRIEPAERISYVKPLDLPGSRKEEENGMGLFNVEASLALAALPAVASEIRGVVSSNMDVPGANGSILGNKNISRVHFSFTGGEELFHDVERAKQLLRNKYPAIRLEDVFVESVRVLLDRIDPERRLPCAPRRMGPLAQPNSPRKIGRAMKDEVSRRDGGQCVYVGRTGQRCRQRSGLEYDHILPWALGGRSDQSINIRLLCRAHNQLEARRIFGEGAVDSAIAQKSMTQSRSNVSSLQENGKNTPSLAEPLQNRLEFPQK